eukprot:scaffold143786_cov22-Tisochrysis_lutea.AAC.6
MVALLHIPGIQLPKPLKSSHHVLPKYHIHEVVRSPNTEESSHFCAHTKCMGHIHKHTHTLIFTSARNNTAHPPLAARHNIPDGDVAVRLCDGQLGVIGGEGATQRGGLDCGSQAHQLRAQVNMPDRHL